MSATSARRTAQLWFVNRPAKLVPGSGDLPAPKDRTQVAKAIAPSYAMEIGPYSAKILRRRRESIAGQMRAANLNVSTASPATSALTTASSMAATAACPLNRAGFAGG